MPTRADAGLPGEDFRDDVAAILPRIDDFSRSLATFTFLFLFSLTPQPAAAPLSCIRELRRDAITISVFSPAIDFDARVYLLSAWRHAHFDALLIYDAKFEDDMMDVWECRHDSHSRTHAPPLRRVYYG